MREVAGGAAILVDPYRIESISEGIKTALLQKKELGKLGRQRVREFSWEKTARMTLDVYKRALK
jgi:glycosyltransferase involved in cell wall biosynthesis